MKQNWRNLNSGTQDPPKSAFRAAFMFMIVLSIIIASTGYVLGWFGKVSEFAKSKPSSGTSISLTEYQWFITRANDIKKMDSGIGKFNERLTNVGSKYQNYGNNKSDWPPHIQGQYNSEQKKARDNLLAVKSQRNGLVRKYNEASEKFNWKPFKGLEETPKAYINEML